MNKRFLIFYISRFSGHYQAANSIKDAILEIDDDVDLKMINAFDYTNPILGKIITKTYLEVVRNKPDFWGNIYDNPEVLEKIKKAREVFHKYNMPKMRKLMETFSPHAICCTQAYPCGMVADYKRTSGDNIFLVGVLTDHAPHSYWLFDEVDIYVVPSNDTKNVLIDKGIDRDKIRVYGIPIGPQFRYSHDAKTIADKLGLDRSLKTVLIMGGNQGLGAMEEVVGTIVADDTGNSCQFVIITGKNKKLYKRLKKYSSAKGLEDKMKVFSYVDNISDFMSIADIIVTKAGGITTAEALAMRVPILVTNSIPGQERMNTDFLVKSRAAVEATDIEDIPGIIYGIINNEDKLNEMKKCAGDLAHPDSAYNIADTMIRGG